MKAFLTTFGMVLSLLLPMAVDAKAPIATPQLKVGPTLEAAGYDTLRSAWREIQSALTRRDWSTAYGRLHHISELRRDLGLPNVYPLSAALLVAAQTAAKQGDNQAAVQLGEVAAALSPNMASTGFIRAELTFGANPIDVPQQIRLLHQGISALERDSSSAVAILVNGLTGFNMALVIVLSLFTVVMLIRYGPAASNDLRRMFRRAIDRFQSMMLFIPILLLPLGFGLGILATIAIWLGVTLFYQNTRERIISLLLLGFLGTLPASTEKSVRGLLYEKSIEATLTRCNESLCNTTDRERLLALSKKGSEEPAALYTLAIVQLREAKIAGRDYSQARAYIDRAIALNDTWQARVVQGNIAYMEALSYCEGVRKKNRKALANYRAVREEAVGYWNVALQASPQSVEALYNLSLVARQNGNEEEGVRLLHKASDLDPERISHWEDKISKRRNLETCGLWARPNRHVLVPVASVDLTGWLQGAAPAVHRLRLPLSHLLSGHHGYGLLPYLAPGIALLAFFLLLFGRFLSVSRPCGKCTSVSDPATGIALAHGAVCGECVLNDASRGVADAKEQWVRERRNEVRQARRTRIRQILGWLIPGLADLLRGATWTGFILLSLFTCSLLIAFQVYATVPIDGQTLGLGVGRLVIFSTIAGLVYLVGFVRSQRGGRRT